MIRRLKIKTKQFIYQKAGIPYSEYGVPLSLLKYLKNNYRLTLIDVGAHNGDFTKALDKYCGISMGILIEPLPQKAAKLREEFVSNKYKVFECALGSEEGVVDFEVNDFDSTSSILRIKRGIPELADINRGPGKIIQCQLRTLDRIIPEVYLNHVDLLKIDVQGAEHLVLAGGKRTLALTSMVWIEVSFKPLYEGSSTMFDIYKLMYESDFKFFELEPAFRGRDGEFIQGDALFIKKS